MLARQEISYRNVYGDIELLSMKTVPYNIYFTTKEKGLTRNVLAVLHRKRDQQALIQDRHS